MYDKLFDYWKGIHEEMDNKFLYLLSTLKDKTQKDFGNFIFKKNYS